MKSQSICAAVATAAFLVGVLVPGCSSSSSRSGATAVAPATSGTAPVGSALIVLATDPVHTAVDVPVDRTLYLTFDADLDAATLGAIELRSDRGPVAIDVTLATPRVVSVRPLRPLTSITPHFLRVTTALRGQAGEAFGQDELVRFTTDPVVPIVGSGGSTPIAPAIPGPFQAGVAVADITPPVGVPLAGFGSGDRRHTPLPDLNPFNDYTFLNPSTGTKDPILSKALVLDNGLERLAIVTIDAVATEANVVEAAVRKATALGFSVPLEKVLVCASHTHSGPGAMSKRLMWQVIAADLFRRNVFETLTDKIATALVQAEQALGPAQVGVGTTSLTGATFNRRAAASPNLQPDSVDPELLVIRVDRPNGVALATVWNFAVHGVHFDDTNLEYSADIMGEASRRAEAGGAGVALFLNGCEGDLEPQGTLPATGQKMADAILRARAAAAPIPAGVLQTVHEQVDLGRPTLSLALHRNAPPSIAGSSFVRGLTRLGIQLGVDLTIPAGWMERSFRFQAIRIGKTVISSLPGEPIHEIGLNLKRDGRALGFDHVIPAALANGHGSYFTTDQEFQFGGYEGMATLFGPTSGTKLQDAARRQIDKLKP